MHANLYVIAIVPQLGFNNWSVGKKVKPLPKTVEQLKIHC